MYTGDISIIWPLFGMSNQLLASCALIICTTMLIRMNKAKYAWITAVPGIFMAVVTFWAGYLQITGAYIPQGKILLATMGIVIMALMIVVFIGAFVRWRQLLQIKTTVVDKYGDTVLVEVDE